MNKLSPQAAQTDLAQVRLAAQRTAQSIQALHRKSQHDLAEAQAELERRAQALSATVSLLNAALESSPDALVVVDLDFRLVAHNRRYAQMWRFPAALVAQGDARALTRFAARQLRDGAHYMQRVEQLRQQPEAELFDTFELLDGRVFERYVSPQRIGERCVGTLIAWRDVTERRQAEALRLAKEVAEAANQSKSAFLSRMSHELRTPLNAILGFSDVLLQDAQAPMLPVQRRHVQRIHDAGQHLLLLIEDVLDVARIDSGMLQVRDEVVDALESVHEAVRSVQVLADARAVQLRVALADGLADCCVAADRTRLQQVLLNLLSNAIKYNRPGGHVCVRLQVQAQGDRLALAVADSGLGLDAAQLQSLFQPFNRLGRERSGVQGTGIGLVISRRLVEMMGGTLQVQSEAGQGSCFSFDLQRRQRPPAALPAASAAAAPAQGAARQARVLYIDDDEVNRLLMQAMLGLRPGLLLELAADGGSGIAAARAAAPDLVLVDMRLPDMDGLQVLQALRCLPALQHVPCLAVSANAMPADIAQALQQGFGGYITKPVATERLFAELDRLLAPGKGG